MGMWCHVSKSLLYMYLNGNSADGSLGTLSVVW